MLSHNQEAFLALVRAGLWENEVRLSLFKCIDYSAIYQFAEEQTVVGLVAAGLEHVVDVKVPQKHALSFVGATLQLEQKNSAMNKFIGELVENLRQRDVYTLLIKGQGNAQCYKRPLWRSCGDVDLFLSDENYQKATTILSAKAFITEEEISYKQHRAFYIDEWEVELHGSLKGGLWHCLNRTLDEVKKAVVCEGNVRSWMNGNTQVFLLGENEDIFFVFAHILQHFFVEGIGLRQICDWCRLLWTYKDSLKLDLLETRIKNSKVMSEWKVFASLAVDYLGMPKDAMPFYSSNKKWGWKAKKIIDNILKTGSFGHNRDMAYIANSPYVIRKAKSFGGHLRMMLHRVGIFPKDAIVAWVYTMAHSMKTMAKGK